MWPGNGQESVQRRRISGEKAGDAGRYGARHRKRLVLSACGALGVAGAGLTCTTRRIRPVLVAWCQ